MEIKNIAIVGAGIMGSDTALDIVSHGYNVILKDLDNNKLDIAGEQIKKSYQLVKMMTKEYSEINLDEIFSRIQFQVDYSNFANADLVIENIDEEMEAKKNVYTELTEYCKKDVIYAINTSCISITKIASFLPNPSNVIGTHFLNPVPLKKLVEVIKGYHTSNETENTINIFLKSLGKNAVIVNDFPGFVTNRLSHLFINEATLLIQDNVATALQIDTIFKDGFGHKMGPLETADLIGLDTVAKSIDVLYESYQDPKYRCSPLLRKMVDAGLLGKKSGKGFYDY